MTVEQTTPLQTEPLAVAEAKQYLGNEAQGYDLQEMIETARLYLEAKSKRALGKRGCRDVRKPLRRCFVLHCTPVVSVERLTVDDQAVTNYHLGDIVQTEGDAAVPDRVVIEYTAGEPVSDEAKRALKQCVADMIANPDNWQDGAPVEAPAAAKQFIDIEAERRPVYLCW